MKAKERNEIDSKFKWSLRDIFVSDDEWQKEFDDLSAHINDLDKFRGKLYDNLSEGLELYEKLSKRLGLCYVYASMRHHEDMTEPFCQGLHDKASAILVKFNSATSFIEPELLEADESKLMEFAASNEKYRHYVSNLIRTKAHILSKDIEEVLANAEEVASASENIFSMIDNADIRFGNVVDENGNELELTKGRFISLMESKNRDVRKNVFETFYKSFLAQKNTIAATFAGSVKSDIFFSKTRKYPSAPEASLFANNIPIEVYKNLVSVVNENLHHLHRYMALRKKRLGLDELHMYDLYTPIVEEADTHISYDEAKATVLKSLEVMGSEYVSLIKNGFENGWIDVYENKGKRGGAYSWGAYGTHPFVLLNFDNKINDMFTLAHEMGHALHSHYTWANQPEIYGSYPTFLAEVASTVNEALLTEYLLNTLTDKTRLEYILNHYLEQFRTTLFRQTMFAEFELVTHEMAERDEPLTSEVLCNIYRGLNEKYYGKDVVIDKEIEIEWARIPHFYNAFYVFQYATGLSAALALSQKILTEGKPAVDAYLGFLKSGSSDYAINILKKAGVDMSTPDPVKAAMDIFGKLVEKMEGI